MAGTALAHPNIALIKYWGKREAGANVPATGSLSITLDALATRTRVEFDATLARDELLLDGKSDPFTLARVTACLDSLRTIAAHGWKHATISRRLPVWRHRPPVLRPW